MASPNICASAVPGHAQRTSIIWAVAATVKMRCKGQEGQCLVHSAATRPGAETKWEVKRVYWVPATKERASMTPIMLSRVTS